MSRKIRLPATRGREESNVPTNLQLYYTCLLKAWHEYVGAVRRAVFDRDTADLSRELILDAFSAELDKVGAPYTDLVVGMEMPSTVDYNNLYFPMTIHWTHKSIRYFACRDKYGFLIMAKDGPHIDEIVEPPYKTLFSF